MQVTRRAVDDDGVARIGNAGGVVDLADRRNAERARDDGDVGMRSAFLQHQAAQALAVVVEQRRRAHRAGDQDGVLRQAFARRRVVAAGELAHQAIGEIVEIVQPLAQERIGLAQHAGAGVGLHAFDRGLRGQSGHHRFLQLVDPAAVVGEHAIGFEHVAMLAALDHVAVLEKLVEIGAQRLHGGIEMLQFLRDIVGNEIGDDDARLVQHDMAERNAVAQCAALDVHRAPRRGLGARQRQRRQLARRDHLGEHHRGGLQRLDFFFRIGAPGAVLHHQHAERVAGAQDRHAEEGVVDFFAGFRPVGERRMRLRVRQVDGGRLARDQADQAFVGTQHGLVHGVALQAFGGIELERGVDAQDIDRAHLRNHVGGDQHHDLVKALLRADRLRHHFAKPAQQHARTAERATHGVSSLGRGFDRCAARSAPAVFEEESARIPVRSGHPPAYIECSMQTASQRHGYDGAKYCAPQREAVFMAEVAKFYRGRRASAASVPRVR